MDLCPSKALSPRVREELGADLIEGGFDELAIQRSLSAAQEPGKATVQEQLRSNRVDRASLADYDRLLKQGAC